MLVVIEPGLQQDAEIAVVAERRRGCHAVARLRNLLRRLDWRDSCHRVRHVRYVRMTKCPSDALVRSKSTARCKEMIRH